MNNQIIVLPFALRKDGTSISTNLANCKGLHTFEKHVESVTGKTHAILHLRFLFWIWSIVLIEPIWGTSVTGGFIDFVNPENNYDLPDLEIREKEFADYVESLGWSVSYPYKHYED